MEQARIDYRAVQSNPMAATYAPLETRQAGDALALANGAADHHDSQEKVDQLAYVAQQKIALTREAIRQKSAEAEIAQAGRQRDQLLLEQRTAEADQSRLNATTARNEAADAKLRTQLARSDAEKSEMKAMMAHHEASEAKRSTQIAQSDADQSAMNAKMAREEATEAKRSTQIAQSEAASAKQGAQAAQADAADAQRLTQEAQARSAQLEAQLSALAAKKTAHGMVITLSDVLFGTDLARLNANGMRSAQKALLLALLEPYAKLQSVEADDVFTSRLALHEQVKTMPWGIVWNEYCRRNNVPDESGCLSAIKSYEKTVLSQRA